MEGAPWFAEPILGCPPLVKVDDLKPSYWYLRGTAGWVKEGNLGEFFFPFWNSWRRWLQHWRSLLLHFNVCAIVFNWWMGKYFKIGAWSFAHDLFSGWIFLWGVVQMVSHVSSFWNTKCWQISVVIWKCFSDQMKSLGEQWYCQLVHSASSSYLQQMSILSFEKNCVMRNREIGSLVMWQTT